MNKLGLKIKIFLGILLLVYQPFIIGDGNLPVFTESQMKAAYLYKFMKFITWTNDAFTSPSSVLKICVISAGEDPFKGELNLAVENEQIGGRPLTVQYLNSPPKINKCHELFISRSQEANLTDILKVAKQWYTLTISDIDNFVEQGGMIQLFGTDNKIGFAIAPEALEAVKLKASPQLLQVANRRYYR